MAVCFPGFKYILETSPNLEKCLLIIRSFKAIVGTCSHIILFIDISSSLELKRFKLFVPPLLGDTSIVLSDDSLPHSLGVVLSVPDILGNVGEGSSVSRTRVLLIPNLSLMLVLPVSLGTAIDGSGPENSLDSLVFNAAAFFSYCGGSGFVNRL